MKNILIFLVMSLTLVGMVSAQGIGAEVGAGVDIEAENNNSEENSGDNNEARANAGVRGNLTIDGPGIEVSAQERNEIRSRYRGNGSFNVNFSQGTNARVKVMPDTASEIAIQQLRLRVCNEENNCTIVLKNTGRSNETNNETEESDEVNVTSQSKYEVRAEKQVRVFGLFRSKMNVQADIDAETGETIQVKRPWWSFLAVDSKIDSSASARAETENEADAGIY